MRDEYVSHLNDMKKDLEIEASRLPRPDCYKDMHITDWYNSTEQMVDDLLLLADKDGCIAAAWALSVISTVSKLNKDKT